MLYSSSQVGTDVGYFTLVSLLFSVISISIPNIIFTLVLFPVPHAGVGYG